MNSNSVRVNYHCKSSSSLIHHVRHFNHVSLLYDPVTRSSNLKFGPCKKNFDCLFSLQESSLPDIFTENSWVSPNSVTRSRSNGKASPEGMALDANKPSSSSKFENHVMSSSPIDNVKEELHPILSLVTPVKNHDVAHLIEPNFAGADPFDLSRLNQEMGRDTLLPVDIMEEEESSSAPRESSPTTASEASSNCINFLEPGEISKPSISVVLAPFYHGTQKIQILHKDVPLHVSCRRLKVRFQISSRFLDSAGRPRLSFVVDASPNLCEILEESDKLAQKLSMDSGSSSEWRPVVTRKPGFWNYPTVRLQ